MSSLALVRSSDMPKQLHPTYQELLNKTANLLLLDSSPEVLCQNVFDILSEPFQLDFYFHFLVSEDETHLERASAGGHKDVRDGLGSHLEFGEAISGVVALTQQEEYLQNMQQRTDEMTHVVRGFGVRCYLCEPLITKGRLVGTLSFGSKHRDSLLPDELQLLRLVAQQVALATSRRLEARKLLQLERLAIAGRMSATLAHEINNPLESLANLLYLIRNKVQDEEGQALVRAAESAVFLLAETTERTLDLYRAKQQKPQVLNLSELTAEILASVSLPQQVPLRSSVEANLRVRAISGELRQVIFNLLLNAAQFSPLGAEVSVAVQRAGEFAEVRIKDQGAGISAKAQARLFQPFYTTRTVGGTGLGLWLSREMVERFGGTLTFESQPAVHPGTEFIVRLPITENLEPAGE